MVENSRYRDKEKAGGQQTREKTINLVSHPRSPLSQKMALLLKDGWTCTQTNTSPNRKERQMEVGTKRGKEKETTSHCVPAFSSSSTFRACFRRHAKRKRAKKKNANNLGRNKKKQGYTNFTACFFFFFFCFVQEDEGRRISRVFFDDAGPLFVGSRAFCLHLRRLRSFATRFATSPIQCPTEKTRRTQTPHVCARVRAVLIPA